MTRTRVAQLRSLIAEVDACLLKIIDATTRLDEETAQRIANLEAARGAMWRLLAEEEARLAA